MGQTSSTLMPAPMPREHARAQARCITFAIKDRAAQLQVRNTLLKAGAHVTPVIGRDYFWAIISAQQTGFVRDRSARAGLCAGRGRGTPGRGTETARIARPSGTVTARDYRPECFALRSNSAPAFRG